MSGTTEKFLATFTTTDQLTEFAKLAEQAERYDEMAMAMKLVTEKEKDLKTELRNMLSVAYKNVVGAKRSSWRVICMIEQKNDDENPQRSAMTKEVRSEIEKELDSTCKEIVDLIDSHLLPNASTDEDKVFYLKMKGDYWRYMAEYKDGEDGKEREVAISKAASAYEEAMTKAKLTVPPVHPSRLGLALNFSVFYYEILNSPDKACALAKDAFTEAIHELDDLKQDDCKDSRLIMQLLRDNLTLWTADEENGDDAQEVQ